MNENEDLYADVIPKNLTSPYFNGITDSNVSNRNDTFVSPTMKQIFDSNATDLDDSGYDWVDGEDDDDKDNSLLKDLNIDKLDKVTTHDNINRKEFESTDSYKTFINFLDKLIDVDKNTVSTTKSAYQKIFNKS